MLETNSSTDITDSCQNNEAGDNNSAQEKPSDTESDNVKGQKIRGLYNEDMSFRCDMESGESKGIKRKYYETSVSWQIITNLFQNTMFKI